MEEKDKIIALVKQQSDSDEVKVDTEIFETLSAAESWLRGKRSEHAESGVSSRSYEAWRNGVCLLSFATIS